MIFYGKWQKHQKLSEKLLKNPNFHFSAMHAQTHAGQLRLCGAGTNRIRQKSGLSDAHPPVAVAQTETGQF